MKKEIGTLWRSKCGAGLELGRLVVGRYVMLRLQYQVQ